jgi:protein-S-isoprenylcysteine O-methyltransferase Ste14
MDPANQRASDTAVAGAFTRPPLLFIACLVLGLIFDRVAAAPLTFQADTAVGRGLSIALIAAGIATMVAAIRNFSRASTPVPSNQPVRALVTSGIHGYSRNPIYIGMFLIYAGFGTIAHSPWVLILAIPLFVIMHYGVIAREETYLERRFGDEYREYKARVRRWL